MAKCVYVATKYEVEYNSNAAFNWKQQEFKELLSTLNCDIIQEDEEGFSSIWEVFKEEFKCAINFLKAHKDDIKKHNRQFINFDDKMFFLEDIYLSIIELVDRTNFDECYNYVLQQMEMFYEKADKNCKNMHFIAL